MLAARHIDCVAALQSGLSLKRAHYVKGHPSISGIGSKQYGTGNILLKKAKHTMKRLENNYWPHARLLSILLVGMMGTLISLAAVGADDDTGSGTQDGDTAATSDSVADETAEPTEEVVVDEEVTEEEEAIASPVDLLAGNVDTLWTCLAAFLVFFMQAGFALVEAGFTRAKNACNIIMKNAMDLSLGSVLYWLFGFGLMFGATSGGFIGTTNFLYDAGDNGFNWAFLIFQTVFCATAATIVSGAMAERTKFVSYLIYTVAITGIVYPVFGHWAWGSLLDGAGWLENMPDYLPVTKGFNDFAGSTVVHSIGGWCALAGAIVIGPRIGKYGKDGKINAIPGHNITLAALGVFILWLGWFGFNPGSTTALDAGQGGGEFARVAVVTNLAAAAGAIVAMFVSWAMFGKPDPSFSLNGALAGLVGITAGCFNMSPVFAMLTGAIAGAIVVFSVVAFDKLKIDDPVGAISVHGVCGAFGTLAVGLWGWDYSDATSLGLFTGGGVAQLIPQVIGVVAGFAWAFPVSLCIFLAIKYTIGLRVSVEEELEGLDTTEHGMHAYPPAGIADGVAGVAMASDESSMPAGKTANAGS